jgi:hypothetical protein
MDWKRDLRRAAAVGGVGAVLWNVGQPADHQLTPDIMKIAQVVANSTASVSVVYQDGCFHWTNQVTGREIIAPKEMGAHPFFVPDDAQKLTPRSTSNS